MTSLTDLKIQNDRVENAIDRMTDILLLIRTEWQPERRELLWQIYAPARLHMNTESARLHEMIESLQSEYKERSMKARFAHGVSVVLLSLLLLAGIGVRAQDTPTADVATEVATEAPTIEPTLVIEPTDAAPEPTAVPEPTQPAPVIVDEVNFRVGVFGLIAIVGTLVLSGFGLGAVWGHIRASKEAKDNIEQAYNALSPEAQEQIRIAREQAQTAWDRVDLFARDVLKLWSEVTDKQPNTGGNVTVPVVPSSSEPGQFG